MECTHLNSDYSRMRAIALQNKLFCFVDSFSMLETRKVERNAIYIRCTFFLVKVEPPSC